MSAYHLIIATRLLVKMFLKDYFEKAEFLKYSGCLNQGNLCLTIAATMVVITAVTKSKTAISSAYAEYAC